MKRGNIPQKFQNPLSRIFDSQRYPIILAPAQCCYNVLFLSAASTIPYHKLFSFPYISFYFLFLIRSQHEVKLSLKSRLFHLLPLFNRGSTCIIWFRLGSVKISRFNHFCSGFFIISATSTIKLLGTKSLIYIFYLH